MTKFKDGDLVVFNGKLRKIFAVAHHGHACKDSYFKPGVGVVLRDGAKEQQHYLLCRPNSNCGLLGTSIEESRLRKANVE